MINRTVLQGRLVRDPELRQTQNGVSVTSFTVAWSEKYKETETKCFLSCTSWRHTADFVNKYFTKGQEIVVCGKLQTRSYDDKEGNKRTVTELTCEEAHFCGSKSDNARSTDIDRPEPVAPPADNDFTEIDDDGDLPF